MNKLNQKYHNGFRSYLIERGIVEDLTITEFMNDLIKRLKRRRGDECNTKCQTYYWLENI
jgi:hypothetical protein